MRSFGDEISGNRRPGGELSTEQRAAIIYALEQGASPTKIAADLHVSRRVVYTTKERFATRNDLKSHSRSGHPTIFTAQDRRYLYLLARGHPWWSYRQLRAHAPGNPSRFTIRRILQLAGLRKRRCKRRIPLKPSTARVRYRFCRRWAPFTTWEDVVFSDECSVQRTSSSGDHWVFRFELEAYRRDLVNPKVHVKDISQMVWAGIWLGGRTKLIVMERDPEAPRGGYTANSYIDALDEGLTPYYTPGRIFQQDNAKIHLAKATQKWFEHHGIYVMDWPAHSPDLNPIEPVWRMLKIKLFDMHPELLDMGRSDSDWDYFRSCILEAWDALDQAKIDCLIRSMPRRVSAIRRARGWYSKY